MTGGCHACLVFHVGSELWSSCFHNKHFIPNLSTFFGKRVCHSSGWPQTFYVAEADLELQIVPPPPLIAEITGLGYHAQLSRARVK